MYLSQIFSERDHQLISSKPGIVRLLLYATPNIRNEYARVAYGLANKYSGIGVAPYLELIPKRYAEGFSYLITGCYLQLAYFSQKSWGHPCVIAKDLKSFLKNSSYLILLIF